MDDMKRAIYMLALEKINIGEEVWICAALNKAFMEITGYNLENFSGDELVEFLPEFFDLFDGKLWYMWGFVLLNLLSDNKTEYGWWQRGWKEPRIRILNYICQH